MQHNTARRRSPSKSFTRRVGGRLATLWIRYSFNQGPLDGWWVGAGFVHTGDKAQRTADPTLFRETSTIYDMPIGRDWKVAGPNWSGARLPGKTSRARFAFPCVKASALRRAALAREV